MANGWTPERRAKQAEAIRKWRPWEKSTGPKTDEGKAKVARNGYKGGGWFKFREAVKELNRAMRAQRQNLEDM